MSNLSMLTLSQSDPASLSLDLILKKRAWEEPPRVARKRPSEPPPEHGVLEIIGAMQKGFAGGTLAWVRERFALSQSEIATLLGLTEKTVRNMQRRETLDHTTSEKLFRMVKAYTAAWLLFRDNVDAVAWLKSPSEALGGATPLTLLSTSEGEALVHTEIAQMQYGHPV